MLGTHLLPLALLAPALALAQTGLRLDSTEEAALFTFEERLFAYPMQLQAPAPLSAYVLVWQQHRDGYSTYVTPGDTTVTLAAFTKGASGPRAPGGWGQAIFYGSRYAVITIDIPVSMLDETRWYFERR